MMFIDWQITRLGALTGLYYLNGVTPGIFHPVFSPPRLGLNPKGGTWVERL